MGKIAAYTATVIVPALICVAATMNASAPGEFLAVRICVWTAAGLIFFLVLWALYRDAASIWHYALAALVIVSLMFGTPAFLRWVDFKEEASHQIPRVRAAFSATQNIKLWAPSLGGSETLNLDNTAVLRVIGDASISQITLSLDTVPARLNDMGSPGKFKAEGLQFQIRDPSKEYLFDTDKNKRHEIKVEGRTFVVVLQDVFPRPKEGSNAFEYFFGISEK
jgi:hypothetical protein